MPDVPLFTHAQDSEGGCFPGIADWTFGPGGVGCVLGATPRAPYMISFERAASGSYGRCRGVTASILTLRRVLLTFKSPIFLFRRFSFGGSFCRADRRDPLRLTFKFWLFRFLQKAFFFSKIKHFF